MQTRRDWLKQSALVTGLVAAPAIVRGQNLNSRLQLASIGSDGKGLSDIKAMVTHDQQQYVAFCDVDLKRTAAVRQISPETPIYQDFREMLAEKSDEIDAVTVSTPDHMHAYCAISAMQLGKHVYCQKPLTHTVEEARLVAEVAKKTGVITRMGNQIHSHAFYRTAVELIQSGRIGKVTQVHAWVAATGHGKSGHISRPPEMPVPEGLDWDKWLGVAPARPFAAGPFGKCYHPFGWRDWQEFGNGAVGDFGCHILDPIYTALALSGPSNHFFAEHSGMNDEVWPAQTSYRFTVPGTEFTAEDRITITWNDGGLLPSTKNSHLPEREGLPRSGAMFIGELGTLVLPHVEAPRLYFPEIGFSQDYQLVPEQDHYHGWIDACLANKSPSADFAYGAMLTETILLANIAVRFPRQKLEWDAAKGRFTSHEEANRWLARDYREGWDLRGLL
jgi:predicted dehydrogenase